MVALASACREQLVYCHGDGVFPTMLQMVSCSVGLLSDSALFVRTAESEQERAGLKKACLFSRYDLVPMFGGYIRD